MAVENAYPPFNSIDQTTNQGVGWDYDTVREICKRLNCVAEFKQAAWDGIFPAMQAGEFDMLADGVTVTITRTKIVDFSTPYVTIGQVLLVRADETRTVDQMKADSKVIVATQVGTTNEIVAKKNFPADRVKSYDDFGAAVLALHVQGRRWRRDRQCLCFRLHGPKRGQAQDRWPTHLRRAAGFRLPSQKHSRRRGQCRPRRHESRWNPGYVEPEMGPESGSGSSIGAALPDLGGKKITVAVENAYPPFNSIDQTTNQGVGWDYDTVREICKRLNCVAEFKQAAWDGIFPAMQAGEYDMLADGVTVTITRTKIVAFSTPYVTIGQVLLVRADETRTVDQMKADSKVIVATQVGTTNEIVAKENFPADRVKSYDDFGAAVLALISKDVDGVVIDNVSASGFMGQNVGKLKVDGQLTSDEQLAFVFPPKSTLVAAVNAALEAMKADGTLDTLNKKWGLTQ